MQAITKVFSDIVKPYIDSENQTLANEVNTMNNVLGAKNLCPNNAETQTISGITYTVNSNGTVTANGTSTAQSNLIICEGIAISFADNSYIVSGGFGGAGRRVIAMLYNSGGTYLREYADITGDGVLMTQTSDAAFMKVLIATNSGNTYDNTVFAPMIRPASIKDSTYVPYTKTNQQLTKDDIGLIENEFANGAVNLLENKASSATVNGITFTVNSDGTISAIGTAEADAALHYPVSIPKGKYKLSGCPSGGSYSTYRIQFQSSSRYYSDEGNGREIDDNITHVYMSVYNGQTVNITFKPMITVADMPNSDYDHYVPYAKSNSELTDDVNNFIIPVSLTIDSVSIPGNSMADIKLNDLTVINVSDQIPSGFKLGAVIFSWSTGHSCVPTQCYVSSANNYRSFALSLYNISSNNITVNTIDVVLICKRA